MLSLMNSGCSELQLCFHRRHTCCQHLKFVLQLLECFLHLFSHDAQARAPLPLRVFITLCVRVIVRLRRRERAYLGVQAG